MGDVNRVKLEVFVQNLNDFVRWVSCVLLLEAVEACLTEHPELSPHVVASRWDLRTPAGLDRINEMGLTVFPTIAIDGEVVFQGRIPDENELLEAIRSRV